MTVLKSCCCFSNVRSGSIASGVYSLVLSLISAGIVAYNLHLYELMRMDISNAPYQPSPLDVYHVPNSTFELGYMSTNNSIIYEMMDNSDHEHMKTVQVVFLCALCVAAFLFGCSIFLIAGVCLDKRRLLMPWIVVMAVNIVLDTGTMTYHTTLIGSLTFIIIEMVIWLLLTVMNIYCLLCVFSQYQELKSGRGTREYMQRTRTRIMYHPNIQQVHINQGPIIINGSLPQAITSSIQTTNPQQNGNSQVTATLLISAPDYNIAAGQLPQYHETTMTTPGSKDPLMCGPGEAAHLSHGSDSPPPPYSS